MPTIASIAFANGQMTVVYADTASTKEVYPLNLITGPITVIDVDPMSPAVITPAAAGGGTSTAETYPLPHRDGTHEATVRFADGRVFKADIRDIASPIYANAAALATAISAEAALAIN